MIINYGIIIKLSHYMFELEFLFPWDPTIYILQKSIKSIFFK